MLADNVQRHIVGNVQIRHFRDGGGIGIGDGNHLGTLRLVAVDLADHGPLLPLDRQGNQHRLVIVILRIWIKRVL